MKTERQEHGDFELKERQQETVDARNPTSPQEESQMRIQGGEVRKDTVKRRKAKRETSPRLDES